MPSQGVFEVLKANKYIHATSEWDPEDQVPPRFTGKFPLPDPRTHLSNPKLFTFTDPEPPRPQSIASHEASGTHNSLTDQPPRPQSIVTHEASDAHVTIKSSNSDTSSERGISIRGVSDGYGGGLNPGPDGYTAQEGNFGGHNLGPGGYGGGFNDGMGGHGAQGGSFGGYNSGPGVYDGGGFDYRPGGYNPGPGVYGGDFGPGPGSYSAQSGNFGGYFGGFHPGFFGYGGGYGGGYRQGVSHGMNSTMPPPLPHPYRQQPLAPAPAPARALAPARTITPAPTRLSPILPHTTASTAQTPNPRGNMTVYRNGVWTTPRNDSVRPTNSASADETLGTLSSRGGRGGRSSQGNGHSHSGGGNRSNRDGRGRDDNSQQRSHRQGVIGSSARVSKPTGNRRRL